MTKLLDLGMSAPLTLGMAGPHKGHLADRIEILARKRPVTKLSRTIAGSVLLGAAALSAPLTIADSHPHEDDKDKTVIMFSDGAQWSSDGKKKLRSGGAYEIITEDGEVMAYQITDGGDTRMEVDVNVVSDDTYELTLQNGEVVTFVKPDLSGLEGLKGLKGLEGLEDLKGLERLSGLVKLEGLSTLSELGEMDFPRMLDGKDVKIIVNGERIDFTGADEESRASLRAKIQSAMKGEGDIKDIRIFTNKDEKSLNRFFLKNETDLEKSKDSKLPDTIIRFDAESYSAERSLAMAERQLEMTERQLQGLSDYGDTSRELKQALRDLAKAKKSLEKARREMEDEDR